MHHCLRAIGIPQLQNRRLSENIGGTETRRMLGIALDLGRAPHLTFDEYSPSVSIAHERSSEEARQSVDLAER